MEVIQNYLDNIFAAYPQTPELLNVKREVLGNMEERYQALLNEGKNKEEALGVVIFEFGNMEELAREMGMNPLVQEQAEEIPTIQYVPTNGATNSGNEEIYSVSEGEAMYFLDSAKKTGALVGVGVALILFGIGLLIFFASFNVPDFFVITPLFVGIAAGVGCFIYAGSMEENSGEKFLKKNRFYLLPEVERSVTERKMREQVKMNLLLAVGIGLMILSPLPIIIYDSLFFMGELGAGFLFVFIGTGVGLTIYSAVSMDAYPLLLKFKSKKKGRQPYPNGTQVTTPGGRTAQYTVQNGQILQYGNTVSYGVANRSKNIADLLDKIYWPIVLILFLFTGFVFGIWYINWIVWPIAAIIRGIIGALLESQYM